MLKHLRTISCRKIVFFIFSSSFKCFENNLSRGLVCFPWLRQMSVSNSVDVRASDLKLRANQGESTPGVDIYSSEVEFVRCDIRGWTGGEWDYSASGSAGVRADEGSRVRISLCEIEGGTGADVWSEWKWIEPGDGAPAVHVRGGSEVVITGDGTQVLQGGHGG
ncbi:MAG TPA: hypothetical protein EYO94_00090, partial [Acidobacteria bacterium]|nr:hypothetical protein [Acidobacteriota bacterium]